VDAGGVKPFKIAERRKLLDGREDWLRARFNRHRGNADVVRQDLLADGFGHKPLSTGCEHSANVGFEFSLGLAAGIGIADQPLS